MSGMPETAGKGGDSGGSAVADAVRCWPRRRGLAVVCGGGPAWGWTVLGEPRGVLTVGSRGSTWTGEGEAAFAVGRGVLADMRSALEWGKKQSREAAPETGPLGSGWVVSLSYELGGEIEPAARRRGPDGSWPLIVMQRMVGPRVFDHARGVWDGALPREDEGAAGFRGFRIGELRSEMGQASYEGAVARGIEYIHAGDVYQVNLAHRLVGSFSGSTREAFAALVESARPWHGAYMECAADRVLRAENGKRAIMSASPELFLKVEGRRVVTRPMKGTWPGSRDPAELRESGKDRAELNMIIDLMRNDLGRVCRFGTVKVEDARAIERHGEQRAKSPRAKGPHSEEGGVWQGVGTVVGELRAGVDVVNLLAAAFPAGSVTGAPKIRAMQIIDELEVSGRGPYCGSIGWIGDDGRVCLNVAIRTALVRARVWKGEPDWIEDGEISYSVGAGIVAESVPRREWEETMQKAGVIRGV
ncbi:MAG: anthranilate synthase component I family protein [Phycisphaeraceae bacterium]|nr:anthranilate synthase component I family protein [Phycisphaeraceae bacterium]